MDIKNTIQHYIKCYYGSEERVIENTICECKCTRDIVEKNIDWLIKNKPLKQVVAF